MAKKKKQPEFVSPNDHRVIIIGRLDFNSKRSVDNALLFHEKRLESHYKVEFPFDHLEFFDESGLSLQFPKYILETTKKVAINIGKMFEFLAEYATSGRMDVVLVCGGVDVEHFKIEPDNDRVSVRTFTQARDAFKASDLDLALELAQKVIKKNPNNTNAKVLVGRTLHRMGREEEALTQINEAINEGSFEAPAFLTRARLLLDKGEVENAILDCQKAISFSVPSMPFFFTIKNLKAEAHEQLGQIDLAIKELKFVAVAKKSPAKQKQKAAYKLAMLLLNQEEYLEAIKYFDHALNSPEEEVHLASLYLYRGIARKKGGKAGFKADWKLATEADSELPVKQIVKEMVS